MPPSRQLARLHTQYRDTTLAIRQRTRNRVGATWMALPDYRDDSVEEFAQRSSRTVSAAAIATATLTAAFIEAAVRDRNGTAARTALDLTALGSPRNVDPLDVYRRPGQQVWYDLSRGVPFTDAVNRGLTRALTLVGTDMQLAKIEAGSQAIVSQPRVEAYERIVGANPCELCTEAAGTLYKSDELMELHDNCSCDLIPVFGEAQFSDATDFGSASTTEHDELGHVLAS